MHDPAVRHIAAAILVTAVLALPTRSRAGQFDMSGVAGFDEFEEEHPATASQLTKNPSLYHDEDWLRRHPTLQVFLHMHPMARAELDEAPEATPEPGEPNPESLTEKKPKRYESPLTVQSPLTTPSPVVHVQHPASTKPGSDDDD